MQTPNPTAALAWTPIIAAFLGGMLGTGGIVAIFNAVINRRRPSAEIRNFEADTDLKKTQTAKTMAEMLECVTSELKQALETQQETSDRMRAMQEHINEMCIRCQRVEALEMELKIADEQIERARRDGFIRRDNEGGKGPNPAAGGPDGILST